METPLLVLIVLLTTVICALAGYWFYRSAQERKQDPEGPQTIPEITHRPVRNAAWDRAVRKARNRNW